MARAGLGADWDCLFANDFDALKARTYRDIRRFDASVGQLRSYFDLLLAEAGATRPAKPNPGGTKAARRRQ